ncbi:unnamed protein product [Musa banksii]
MFMVLLNLWIRTEKVRISTISTKTYRIYRLSRLAHFGQNFKLVQPARPLVNAALASAAAARNLPGTSWPRPNSGNRAAPRTTATPDPAIPTARTRLGCRSPLGSPSPLPPVAGRRRRISSAPPPPPATPAGGRSCRGCRHPPSAGRGTASWLRPAPEALRWGPPPRPGSTAPFASGPCTSSSPGPGPPSGSSTPPNRW